MNENTHMEICSEFLSSLAENFIEYAAATQNCVTLTGKKDKKKYKKQS